jgi:serine protease Do
MSVLRRRVSVAALIVLFPSLLLAQNTAPPAAPASVQEDLRIAGALSRAFNHAAEAIGPSVVHVTQIRNVAFQRGFFSRIERRDVETGAGSGVIVSDDGYILTNNHVIEDATSVKVHLNDGRELDGKIIGSDPGTDLGLVKVEATGLTPAKFGDSDGLQIGDWVLAVGSPFGRFDNTFTAGIVSAKGRTNLAGPSDGYQDFIQTDAAINPGNSGGPLVNLEGRVVGINSQIASRTGGSEGLGFAIPSSIAEPVTQMLLKNGKVERGWLGIAMMKETPAGPGTPAGVIVQGVIPGGPAATSGLRPGDVIVRYNNHTTESTNRLKTAIALTPPGTRAELDVLRDGGRVQIPVQIVDATDGRALAPGGQAVKPYGFSVANIPSNLATQLGVSGVVVNSIDDSSPAARAGLQAGDIIVHLGGKDVSSVDAFDQSIQQLRRQQLHMDIVRLSTGQTGFIEIAPRR